MAKVYAPNEEFRGTRFGVSFKHGQAETDDPIAIGRLLRAGYRVDDSSDKARQVDPVSTKELADHTKAELKELAAAEGIDLAGHTTKAEYVEAIESARSGSN